MKTLVNNGFGNMKIPELLELTEGVITQITTHVQYYPSPEPTIVAVQNSKDALSASNAEAQSGDKYKMVIRDEDKLNHAQLLQKLGIYVNLKADGRRDVAELSGFPIRKESAKRMLTMPPAPVAKLGVVRGTIEASIPSQASLKSCTWYITSDATQPLNTWTGVSGGTSKHTFVNLVPGVTYYMYVVLNGTNKQEFTSEISMLVA